MRAEIGAAARFGDRDVGGEAGGGGSGGARRLGDAAADHFEADQFDRLLDAGAVAVGALVLGAEGFLERRQRRGIEPAGRQRHAQFEGLPLVMQAGAAPDLDALRAEPVVAEPAARLGFEPIDDRLHSAGRRARAAAICGCG